MRKTPKTRMKKTIRKKRTKNSSKLRLSQHVRPPEKWERTEYEERESAKPLPLN